MTKIRYIKDLPTIAQVNRYTGIIDVNDEQFRALPSMLQRFIIEHENGHFNLQTSNEFEADNYAFHKIAGTGNKSLKSSVEALTKCLDFKNPQHKKRLYIMLTRALWYDYKVNKNKEAFKALVEIINSDKMNTNNFTGDTTSILTGLLSSQNQSSGSGSAMGPPPPPSGGSSFDWGQAMAVGSTAMNLINQNKNATNTTATPSTSRIEATIVPNINLQSPELQTSTINWDASISSNNDNEKPKDNTFLYVGIAVAVVVVLGVVSWLIIRKRG